ncbi:glucosamine-6-phosphate deaminase [Rhizobium skierniewicense]|uniref:Glucosamine-6-phosphate deaminase n=1 Tax=Rhizobium skierniewicense TaxID=984260 RepID=A0A7W6CBQ2_9HYPH|nr:glucosamine-6-phosphate deaminase [Rhizobium skierniewicense]MBB3946877.1 glucosamine-6-phosphate deaminase [Rhizobium skierniewicense]
MTPIILADAPQAANAVAERIIAVLRDKPEAVLGLATGATMEPVYAALVAAYLSGRVSFSRTTTFNLDEYVGIPPDHPGSYRATMNRLLFDHVDIELSRTHVPDGMAANPEEAAEAYELQIRQAGCIDLQLLGIGRNGHIGFNEPGSTLQSRTRHVVLHSETLAANQDFFEDAEVPRSAITMGIATILTARSILVLATGNAKQSAVRQALAGGYHSDCPASALAGHTDVTWILDDAAAQSARVV